MSRQNASSSASRRVGAGLESRFVRAQRRRRGDPRAACRQPRSCGGRIGRRVCGCISGGSNGSVERMRTWPRDSGHPADRQREAGKRVHGAAGQLRRQRRDVELVSGVVATGRPSVAKRMRQPAWLMPIADEPVRNSNHCRPILILPSSELSSSLVVIGRVHSNRSGGSAVVLQVLADRAVVDDRDAVASSSLGPCPTAAQLRRLQRTGASRTSALQRAFLMHRAAGGAAAARRPSSSSPVAARGLRCAGSGGTRAGPRYAFLDAAAPALQVLSWK